MFHVKHGPTLGRRAGCRTTSRRHPDRSGSRARRAPAPRRRPTAAAGTAARLHHRQPEGRRRQDDHRRQRRGRARAAGAEGPRDRPRPAGQRQHRARRRAPPGHPVVLRSAHRRDPTARRAATQPAQRAPVLRAGHHRPGGRRDRIGQHGRARRAAAHGAGRPPEPRLRLRLHRLPAVAGPADHQRARRRARGVDPHPVRVLRARGGGPVAAQHRDGQGAPQPAAERVHRHPDDVRRADQARRPGRRRTSGRTSATRCCGPSSRAASRCPRRRATA